MTVLFISRKKPTNVGGLSRFYKELITHFPENNYALDPSNMINIFNLPFFKIDVIHLCDATLLPLGLILKFLLKKPLSVTAHGLDLTFPNPIYQKMLSFCLPKVDSIILDSEEAYFLLKPFNLAENKIQVVKLSISIEEFRTSKSIQLPEFEQNFTILLTNGNLVLRKGHAWFLEKVFSKLPPKYYYLIVGDGPERLKISKLIKKLNLNSRVFLLGRLSDQELSYIYKKTDIYVCPNQKIKGNFEGFGLACGEAAALGLPVIASNVDGIPEVIKNNQNGLLISPTTRSFISAIGRLKDPEKRKVLGKKAKNYTATHYNWGKTTSYYLQVFEELISKT